MNEQWSQAVTKLIDLTEAGALNWRPDEELAQKRRAGTKDEIISPAFVSRVEDRRIAVYEYRYSSESSYGIEWDSDTAIEFIDETDNCLLLWPSVPEAVELLEAIRLRVVDADGFLQRLLAK